MIRYTYHPEVGFLADGLPVILTPKNLPPHFHKSAAFLFSDSARVPAFWNDLFAVALTAHSLGRFSLAAQVLELIKTNHP